MEEIKKIWTNKWNTITMTERIKEKCAVDEHRWERYLIENRFG